MSKMKLSKNITNMSHKVRALVVKKDHRAMYVIIGIIILIVIGVFVYLYLTKIWSTDTIIVLQDGPVDGRKGIKYIDALKLSDTSITYACTFSFWIKLNSMSNMQETETNYILSYDMNTNGNYEQFTNTGTDSRMTHTHAHTHARTNQQMTYEQPYFNVIYGDFNDTSKNQITVSFKNMNNTEEYITIRNIELQKWLCIQIVMRDVIIDFYMNGELIQSKTLNYIPILSNKGTLTIGKENGFNGTMTKLTYYNYALKESDLGKYYDEGHI